MCVHTEEWGHRPALQTRTGHVLSYETQTLLTRSCALQARGLFSVTTGAGASMEKEAHLGHVLHGDPGAQPQQEHPAVVQQVGAAGAQLRTLQRQRRRQQELPGLVAATPLPCGPTGQDLRPATRSVPLCASLPATRWPVLNLSVAFLATAGSHLPATMLQAHSAARRRPGILVQAIAPHLPPRLPQESLRAPRADMQHCWTHATGLALLVPSYRQQEGTPDRSSTLHPPEHSRKTLSM